MFGVHDSLATESREVSSLAEISAYYFTFFYIQWFFFCRFCKSSDENKKQKVIQILDKLIVLTIQEVEMYPSIQAKIWGGIGKVNVFNIFSLMY